MWANYIEQEKLDVGKNRPGGYRKAKGQFVIGIGNGEGAMRLWKHEAALLSGRATSKHAKYNVIADIKTGKYSACETGAEQLTQDIRSMAIKGIENGKFGRLPLQYRNELHQVRDLIK